MLVPPPSASGEGGLSFSQMPKWWRVRNYWLRVGEALRVALGGRCWVCGATGDLEFDCIVPMGDKHHRWETNRRMSFYKQQFLNRNLQLLCEKHHAKKSKAEQYWLWNQVQHENER